MLKTVQTEQRSDRFFMVAAVDEAIDAIQRNSNYGSQVGCALEYGGNIISRAHNDCYEGERMHAEEIVLRRIGDKDLSDATLYTTVEPCNGNPYHTRKHCCEQIVDADIRRVVIGTLKKKKEGGAAFMREHGVEVSVNGDKNLSHLCRLLIYSNMKGQPLSEKALEKILNSRKNIDVGFFSYNLNQM